MHRYRDMFLKLPGVFGFFAARTCHQQLSAVRAATEISVDEGIEDPENDESRNGVATIVSCVETLS